MLPTKRSVVNRVIILSAIVVLYAVVIQTSNPKRNDLGEEIFAMTQDKWNLEELDKIEEVDTKEYLIPNIAHYLWYGKKKKELKFHAYLSILSAARLMKADKIYFHTNNEPIGEYWEEAKKLPNFIIKQREPPTKLFGIKLKKPVYETSDSNADRVKILQEYGGAISDLDVLYLKSLNPLRKYPAVLGLEIGRIICGGFIMSAPNSTFVYLWLNRMLSDYQVDKWGYISGILPSRLVKRYNMSGLVHVLPRRIHHPNYNEFKKIIGPVIYDWERNYALHLFHRLWRDTKYNATVAVLNPETIQTMNTTFGQIARKIYYGTPDLIFT